MHRCQKSLPTIQRQKNLGYAVVALNDDDFLALLEFMQRRPPLWLRAQVDEHAPGLQLIERLAHPPAFADVDADRALKVGAYRAARRTD